MATKNAHVFASSSFGFGYTNLFQSKERRQHHSDDEERETRDEKGKEGGEEEEDDVLRLFVFFSEEFRRGVVFVSRVESKRG